MTRVHGFVRDMPSPIKEGDKMIWTIDLPDHSFTIENYFLEHSTLVSAFNEAGMAPVEFHPARLGPAAHEAGDEEFWAAFLKHCAGVFIEAKKS